MGLVHLRAVEPYISAGYELFTWNNGVNNNIFNIIDNITYYLNNHKITAGVSFEYQMANNSYMRNGTGYYRYANIDDFLNQAAPRDFALTYGYDGETNPAAEVAFNQFGLYVQDEWNVNSDFKLTYGVRADYLKYVDNLITNNAILHWIMVVQILIPANGQQQMFSFHQELVSHGM